MYKAALRRPTTVDERFRPHATNACFAPREQIGDEFVEEGLKVPVA